MLDTTTPADGDNRAQQHANQDPLSVSGQAADQRTVFDLDLIKRYDQSGPRYTSYPTAVEFDPAFDAERYAQVCRESNASGRPLSLYFHIPFCDTVCFYCACNKIATKDRSMAQPYLDRVYKELEMQSALFDDSRVVEQLHWGGGTPTFISQAQMRELMDQTRKHFKLADDEHGEFSIEIDPREARGDTVKLLREIGFNRMSLGVQDFDERVQKAVNRIQTEAETMEVLQSARDEGFRSISIDSDLRPALSDRGRLHGARWSASSRSTRTGCRCSTMRTCPPASSRSGASPTEDLPPPEVKLDILQATTERLTMCRLAVHRNGPLRPPRTDESALAQRDGTLYRNFQGYSTHADCDLIGVGVTSIGMVANTYGQNLPRTRRAITSTSTTAGCRSSAASS